MNFIKRHPYLFWQFIGLLILAVDCLYLLCNLENEHISYAFIVLLGMLAFAIITLSPFVIKSGKKFKNSTEIESSYRYKYIEKWYVKNYGGTKAVAVIIAMFLLLIGGTMVLIYIGVPFFAFLLFYPELGIYRLWQKYVKCLFYKVPDGAKKCVLVHVNDTEFLDVLYSHIALAYLAKPSTDMLNLLYNRFYNETLNQKRLLMNDNLKIYMVNAKLLNEKYGFTGYDLHMQSGECLLCILPDEFNPEVLSLCNIAVSDCELGSCLFPEYVDNCQAIANLL